MKPKYKQPHNIRLPRYLNEAEESYLRDYLHHKEKYEARYMRSKNSKRERW